ncbi:uroporphyrinogen decarboxylase [Candidatus Anaplasma sp. TIGMIC]|uniref:uroporphyrinogen decarboxylase n=1 Tax=Candidatus Anaplasma sp. TIGMIC TaxID=3020713 RepID=UPI00232EBD08|nr:uroporphyrinogen decarboxylase [Candidatus Anaplasma sp. TIGMIC]MDB1135483.1 uroporphyrinogen decarboxylase [Candidatus Anaplasma sp. TIGMIC]
MFDSKEHTNRLRASFQTTKNTQGIPIWYMRQAGRYLPEYQKAMHGRENFLSACYTKDLVTEVTLQPIERFDIDAAIIFSDIMVVPDVLGFDVQFYRGHGPKINIETRQIRCVEESLNLTIPVLESIRQVRSILHESKALIGFAGSPWTVATYILGHEKNTTELIRRHRSGDTSISNLIEEITNFTALYLRKQIEYGADVIQLFDSNAGGLPFDLFKSFVINPTQKIVAEIQSSFPDIPIIGFPKGAGVMYKDYSSHSGVQATCVDYSIPPYWIKDNISCAIQGNLDPSLLAYDIDTAISKASEIVSVLKNKPLIFNLGHGIIPSTPPDNVKRLTDHVRSL